MCPTPYIEQIHVCDIFLQMQISGSYNLTIAYVTIKAINTNPSSIFMIDSKQELSLPVLSSYYDQ